MPEPLLFYLKTSLEEERVAEVKSIKLDQSIGSSLLLGCFLGILQ